MKIISKKEAKEQGLKHYFTGKQCKHGHISKRRVGNGTCFTCHLSVNSRWRDKNPAYMAEWYQDNKDYASEQQAKRYLENKEEILGKCKEYRDKNRAAITIGWLDWARRNPDKFRVIQKRYETKTEVKMMKFMRRSVHRALSGAAKNDTTLELLGYSNKDLMDHLESGMENWMSWENYGSSWHVDHIVPVSHFVSAGELDPAVVNSLSNLRPLCAKENMRKGAKMDWVNNV